MFTNFRSFSPCITREFSNFTMLFSFNWSSRHEWEFFHWKCSNVRQEFTQVFSTKRSPTTLIRIINVTFWVTAIFCDNSQISLSFCVVLSDATLTDHYSRASHWWDMPVLTKTFPRTEVEVKQLCLCIWNTFVTFFVCDVRVCI